MKVKPPNQLGKVLIPEGPLLRFHSTQGEGIDLKNGARKQFSIHVLAVNGRSISLQVTGVNLQEIELKNNAQADITQKEGFIEITIHNVPRFTHKGERSSFKEGYISIIGNSIQPHRYNSQKATIVTIPSSGYRIQVAQPINILENTDITSGDIK